MQPAPLPQSAVWQGPDGIFFEVASSKRIEAPALKVLFAYWLGKVHDRVGPARSEITLKDIPTLLPSIHLYDVQDQGCAFLLRVAGTHIVAAIGSDPTGKVLASADREPVYARLFAGLNATFVYRRPIRCTAERSAAPERNFLSAEHLSLPLSDDGVTINKILICTIFKQPRSLL